MTRRTNRATKDLEHLPQVLRDKAEALIERLQNEPALGKKLKGKLDGKRSLRLGRTHRIIYTSDPLVILTVVARRDAYR
ncbi:type II toxin-antitoxin system RelE family toxin [Mycolicibacterium litorale]|uniref:type II toxin-antitoxin system RelE family toxin n=1 Tax=Mycolicibacterium litorale TaxID=758802 RepID=UPI003CF3DA3D